jgi:hypothetical protein
MPHAPSAPTAMHTRADVHVDCVIKCEVGRDVIFVWVERSDKHVRKVGQEPRQATSLSIPEDHRPLPWFAIPAGGSAGLSAMK